MTGLLPVILVSAGLVLVSMYLGSLLRTYHADHQERKARSDRYAAARLRHEAQQDRREAERVWALFSAECEGAWGKEGVPLGRRIAEQWAALVAERNDAREDAKDWKQVALNLEKELEEERARDEAAESPGHWTRNNVDWVWL